MNKRKKLYSKLFIILFIILLFGVTCIDFNAATQELTVTPIENERLIIDYSAILGLLGVGLLKFIDDKIRVKWRDKYLYYKRLLIGGIVLFSILELLIIAFMVFSIGSPEFGNLKNAILGGIPVLFCVITLSTSKNETNSIVVSHDELEKKINDFTSCSMSPLGIIVGDMDFLGKVYKNDTTKKKGNKRKTDNIINSTQIKTLKDNNIDTINIVCKIPTTNEAKLRIGYLLTVFGDNINIKFYNRTVFPKIRGRIMYRHSSQVVVITRKIRKPSQYEYCEYKTDTLTGTLFADLWETVWEYAEENTEVINECKEQYDKYVV